MEELFLRVLAVSGALALLLLPLLLCRRWLVKKYAPQTRYWLWLAVALVLLIAPWLPKPQAPVVLEAPAYTLPLPVQHPQPQAPAKLQGGQTVTPVGDPEAEQGGGGIAAPTQPNISVQPVAPAEPEGVPPPDTALSLTTLTAWVWLAGVAASLLWQGGQYVCLRRRLLKGARQLSGLEPYAAELGLEEKADFYLCDAVSGPMTLGLFHPVVLLPEGGAVPAALRHELCHIKRRDVAYKALLLLACCLHWFDPLVWWMARMAGQDVEACCDAEVVAGQDTGYRRSYGELLLSAAGEGRSLPFTTRFGGGKEQMRARLTQLFRPGKRSRALVCVLLAAAVLLSGLVACREESKDGEPLADGTYCALMNEVIWPLGEADAEGEDYGRVKAVLYRYDAATGPSGPALGEYTLPLSGSLMIRTLWWGEDTFAGKKGSDERRRAVADLLNWPAYRDSTAGREYLVLEVKGGEAVRLSQALVSGNDVSYVNSTYHFYLRLPDNWAGDYRVEEDKTEIRFLYQENDEPLLTLHIVDTDVAQGENWVLVGVRDVAVYAELPAGEEDTPWGKLREELRGQLEELVFSWLYTAQALTENTMPHLDFYDPETQFLVYHTQTSLYFNYGGSHTQETFRCDQTWGRRVLDRVDVRFFDGAVLFSDCAVEGGQEGRYYCYNVEERTVEELDGPFDPEPELLAPADPARIFDQGMYQPTHTYSLWSNALRCADGTLAALAVNGILEGGGTLDALEIVRMGESWWEENRLLTPEKLPAHGDYVSPDWGFILHLPRSFEGQYLIQRDYNASGLPCWSFYHRDSYAGPSGSGFLFTLFAQDAETFRANGYEGDTVLKEQNGIVYTMTTLPYREDWFSGDYLELLEAAESITGEDLDLSGVTRSTGYLWPVPGTGQGQDVVLRMFGQDGLDGVSLLFPYGGWAQSVAAGTVSAVRKDPGSGFYTVSVDHGSGIVTSYGHLSNVWVAEGEQTLRGGGLGPVGESDGRYSLVFAWQEKGQYINPINDVEWKYSDFSVVDPVELLYAGDQHIPAALRAVLLGEATFYNVETGEYCYADALPFSDDVPVKVFRFTELDMDNDAIPEAVLWLERGDNEYVLGGIVLHYQNGWVCGYPMGYRSLELESLKTDGTYGWSGGAFHWGWGRLDFSSGKTRDISWCEESGEEELYYVEQLPAAAAEFEAAHAVQAAKENVTWMELTRENIALVY